MANHMRDDGSNPRAKQASLLASANAARNRAAAHAPQQAEEPGGKHAGNGRAGNAGRAGADGERIGRFGRAGSSKPAPQGGPAGRQAARAQREPETLAQFARRNASYLASAVAVVAVFVIVVAAVRWLMPLADAPEADEPAYESPYDWSKLDRSDGRYAYVVDGQAKSQLGVDVSDHQHEIDWQAVADDGIDFAMVRLGYRGATEGELYLDENFEANLEGARTAGLACGVYFFSQARDEGEARKEADFVIEQLKGAPLDYPIAFDSEEQVLDLEQPRTAGLGEDEMTAIAEAFCDRVEAAGYRSMVYGNRHDLSRYRYESMQARDLWWAEYGTPEPAANIDIVMWQYSSSGQVAGIEGGVDMDLDLARVLASS